jgi:hypothetical protein
VRGEWIEERVNVECIEEEENKRSGFETEIGTSSSKNLCCL